MPRARKSRISPRIGSVAIIGIPDEMQTGGPVYGATVVALDFVKQLRASGRKGALLNFSENSARRVKGELRYSPARIAEGLDQFAIHAWLDIAATASQPFEIRRKYSCDRPFPITVVHHTVSYAQKHHAWYLKILLGDFREYDSIVCTSNAARDAIRRTLDQVAARFNAAYGTDLRYRGRLDVIPLGVDTTLFKPRDKKKCRQQFGLPDDRVILLWIGRLSPTDKANLLPLVSVMANLAKTEKKHRPLLVIAGNERSGAPTTRALDDYAAELGITDSVTLLGAVAPEVRHFLHSAADIFVSPVDNIQETFGLTPVEAMSCGVPQVVSDWDGYRDTVDDGVTGFRVPTLWVECDAAASADALLFPNQLRDHFTLAESVAVDTARLEARLRELIRSPTLRERQGQASRRRALALFGWKKVLTRYEKLWGELADLAHARGPAPIQPTAYTDAAFFSFYRGYASRIIDGDDRISITKEGLALLNGARGIPAYFENQGGPNCDKAFRLLQRLRRLCDSGNSSTSVQTSLGIKTVSTAEKPAAEHAKLAQLMWLAKHGFIAFADAPVRGKRTESKARERSPTGRNP